jgi:GT2 family glycosyltransferase
MNNTSPSQLSCSVLIATYNRAALLDECLAHLKQQRFIPGDEVLVVDNGSSDATRAVLERHAVTFPVPLLGLFEPAPGKSRALALAVAAARGDILAFTDDDVNVAPDWLTEIRNAISMSGVDVVGGPVAPRWEGPAPWWLRIAESSGYSRLAAPLALLNYGNQSIDLGPRTLLGANLAVRRDAYQQLGGLAPHLGKLRGTLLSGEDHDLCRRAQAAGFRAAYLPTVRVAHWVPRSRMRLRYFLSWFYWSGVTNAELDDTGARTPAYRIAVAATRRLVATSLSAVSAVGRGRMGVLIERLCDAAFAIGYAARQWRARVDLTAVSASRKG